MKLIALTTAALALAFATSPSALAAPHHCGDLYQQTDVGPHSIFTRNVRCATARHILRHWENDASAPDSGPRGWECAVKSKGAYAERHYCHRHRGIISFTLLYA